MRNRANCLPARTRVVHCGDIHLRFGLMPDCRMSHGVQRRTVMLASRKSQSCGAGNHTAVLVNVMAADLVVKRICHAEASVGG